MTAEEMTGDDADTSRCTPCMVANAVGILFVVAYFARRLRR